MENSVECLLAWLSLAVLGCSDIPINPQYGGTLLCRLLRDCDASVVICDSDYAAGISAVAPDLPSLRLVAINGPTTAVFPPSVVVVELAACESGSGCLPVDRGEGKVILYTSGTTGPSKGVVHTQQSCLVLSRYNAKVLGYDRSDRLLNFFPLYHQNARYTGVVPALCVGASIRLGARFSSSTFWATCDADGVTAFNYLGSVLRLILNVTPPERVAGTHTITKAFGAGASPADWTAFEERLGVRLVESYGLSEAPMATINVRHSADAAPIGSAGRASELFDIAVVDGADQTLNPGEVGEIVLRPRVPDAIMSGYNGQAEETVRSFRNLWFHSGDRGRLSEDGHLYFEERGKDSIRRRGENISAWEVEAVLNAHADVAESAVYGLPSEELDEEVCAALVLRRSDADITAILCQALESLPRYAVPTLIRIMDDLPRTPTAKVQKDQLRREGRSGCVQVPPPGSGRQIS